MDKPLPPSNSVIEASFLDFIHASGITPAHNFNIIIDGNIHRFPVANDRNSQTSGAYCVYNDDWPIGWVTDWHFSQIFHWFYKSDGNNKIEVDYLNSQEFKEKVERAKALWLQEKIKSNNEAANRAGEIFHSSPFAPENHPYLTEKHIFPYGVKISSENRLIVPIRNIYGDIRSLQFIAEDGQKRFLYKASLDGAFWNVGLDTVPIDKNSTILLGEGFATMAKIYELTSLPCVAAISCNHIEQVATILKEHFPLASVIITADNDKATKNKIGRNPGLDAACACEKKGLAVDVIFPTFNDNDNGSDWDDFAVLYGDDFTALTLRKKIDDALIPKHIKDLLHKSVIINAQDLRTKVFPPVKWAVDGFLPAGLSILAGGPKVGKSILALHLAVGVAIGGCVLGKINVQQGDVLYLALEDTQRRLQERINGGSFADVHEDMSHLTLITQAPRQHLGGSQIIQYWLSVRNNPRLIIIDTLQMFRKQLSGKGSMYSEDYETVSNIKSIADKFNVAILLIHHLKKGLEGDWLSEISGSQGIAGAADTIFSLKRERNSNMGTLRRTGRDVEEKDFILKLDGYGWTLQGEAEQFTQPEWKRQILDFLKQNLSITPMQLAQAYGLNISTAKMNLTRLVKEGLIKKTGYGTYGLPEEE